jgi:hypothetical protein
VSLQKKTFSNIKPQVAESYDDFFQFKQTTYPFSEGLTLNNIAGLSAINDSTINNYSGLVLTDRLKDSDIYNFNTKQIDISNIVGTIQFSSGLLYFDDVSSLGQLPINVYNEVFTPGYNSVSVQLSGNIIKPNNSYFEIVIVDSLYCKIRHCVEDSIFYLVYQPGVFNNNDFFFTKTPQTFCIAPSGVDNSSFYCLYDNDDGFASLYKPVSTISGVDVYGVSTDSSKLTLVSVATGGYVNSTSNLVKVNVIEKVDPKINTSWISYSIDGIENGLINGNKSLYNIKDNHLLTFEYSKSPETIQFRDLKLKNILTDTNTSNRGCIFDSFDNDIPSVNHREYTTITTGNNDEKGYPYITLHYQTFTKDIFVKAGSTTLFQTGSSLYPYEKLNINDSAFVINGSLGGLTPDVSDRITLRSTTQKNINGGSYLTTWLSAGDINSRGIWVDRYYIPDLVTKQQAFSSIPAYNPTFANSIEQMIYNNANYTENVSKNPVFDKMSDLVFVPNEWYEYTRVGVKDIETNIINIGLPSIKDFEYSYTYNGKTQYDTPQQTFSLNGSQFTSIPSMSINENNSFTLKFDYDIDWKNNDFYQLLGNSYQTGFGIFKNNKITPFVYMIDGVNLRVYNTDLKFLFEVVLKSNVHAVLPTKYLGDIIVIDDGGSVYKISTAGVLKQYIISGIPGGSISWTQDNTYMYFLYPDGSCVKLDVKTLESSQHIVTPFNSSETVRAITIFDDVVYGISGECVRYDTTFGFISGGADIIRYNFKDKTKESFASCRAYGTNSNIICTVSDEYVYVANCNAITKLTKNRQYVTSTSLVSLSSNPVKIDTIREFDENGNYTTNIVYVSKSTVDGSVIITRYDGDLNENLNKIADISSNDYREYVLTNYNMFDTERSNDTVRISIALVNLYDRKDIDNQYIDIPIDKLSNIGSLVLRCDTNQGNFTIFNNYQKLGNISFNPAKYRLDDLFYDDIFIGTAGSTNNTPLMNVIYKPNYYTVHDGNVSNFKIYNTPLEDYEIHSLLLESQRIQDVTLTLPCGQRNNIEEIRRMFFFQPPNSKSTDVDIVIKNSTITNTSIQQSIKDRILFDIKKYLPGNVNINNITFEQYRDD